MKLPNWLNRGRQANPQFPIIGRRGPLGQPAPDESYVITGPSPMGHAIGGVIQARQFNNFSGGRQMPFNLQAKTPYGIGQVSGQLVLQPLTRIQER